MKILLCLFLALTVSAWAVPESETMTERDLRLLVGRQKELLAKATKEGAALDQANFETQMQHLCLGYETLLRGSPNYAPAYAAYGYLLSKIGMTKESAVVLMKANQLDENIPLVKNQLGNLLAEQGKPLEAVNYYLAAIKLVPDEPLYHYQLGTLLHAARADFIGSGDWTAESVDAASHEGFRKAAELAPDRLEFTYRYAESFYDLEKPDWDAALEAWGKLEQQAHSEIEKETMRLQAANVCVKAGKLDHAKILLESVTDPKLTEQKQKLVAQLSGDSDK